MNLLRSVALIALLTGLLAGCSTPRSITDLSKSVLETHEVVTKQYAEDLRQTREFVGKVEDVLHQQRVLTNTVRELARVAQYQQTRTIKAEALAQFDQQAFELVTRGWDEAWEKQARPIIKAYEHKLQATKAATEAAALQDRLNGRLQEQYAASVVDLVRFQIGADNAMIEGQAALVEQVRQKRAQFVEELDAKVKPFLSRLEGTANDPLAVIRESQTATQRESVLTNTIAVLDQKDKIAAEYDQIMRDALKELDSYLQNNGYTMLFVKSFFTGAANAIREKIPGLKQDLARKVPIFGELGGVLLDTVDAKLAGLPEQLSALAGKFISDAQARIPDLIKTSVDKFANQNNASK